MAMSSGIFLAMRSFSVVDSVMILIHGHGLGWTIGPAWTTEYTPKSRDRFRTRVQAADDRSELVGGKEDGPMGVVTNGGPAWSSRGARGLGEPFYSSSGV